MLPHKKCLTCKRDFVWRKKWRASWETVLYCSARCRGNKKSIDCSTNR
ncbi:DUF2256 domain-containing protein [Psychromonas antarctica]